MERPGSKGTAGLGIDMRSAPIGSGADLGVLSGALAVPGRLVAV
ncbi:hypothetical protein [Bifidobacterium xylocopae]|nr:hypothetical protein [Bifidobacterium xylocopae]